MRLVIVIIIMVIVGTFGGMISYVIHESISKVDTYVLIRYVLIGVAASILVPIFFQITQSRVLEDLLEQPQDDLAKQRSYLVFAAVCLLASMSGLPFISSISSQAINKRIDSVGTAIRKNTAKIDSTRIDNINHVASVAKTIISVQNELKDKGVIIKAPINPAIDSIIKEQETIRQLANEVDTTNNSTRIKQ